MTHPHVPLFLSPVSLEALDVILTCHDAGLGVHLICSTSQVCPVVNGRKPYTGVTHERIAKEREKRPTLTCQRDHLGRGGEDLWEWVERDAALGFNGWMLHVFELTQDTIALIDRHRSDGFFELGPGEDDSRPVDQSMWALRCVDSEIDWASAPTGCLIDGMGNTGTRDWNAIRNALWDGRGLKQRAHNCDYLSVGALEAVARLYDGINIAPQLGCVQSCAYLGLAATSGIDVSRWMDACTEDAKNIARWSRRVGDIVPLVGHYHYDALPDEFRERARPYVLRELRDFVESTYYIINPSYQRRSY